MKPLEMLNPLAKKTWARLIKEHPNWDSYFGSRDEDDLEVAIPAPPGSNAGHLVIFTTEGKEIWLRFGPPRMFYAIDDLEEMLSVINSLLREEVSMVVISKGGEWKETTLIRREQDISLEPGQKAQIVSWYGSYDKTLPPS
ncbi:MAG: hypothetical protein LAP21_15405 [Acidobacteriia bacterium]|nr:hypothetical protein [Terriglobia bacterium]